MGIFARGVSIWTATSPFAPIAIAPIPIMDALVNTAPTNKDRTDTNMTNRCNRVRSIFSFIREGTATSY